MQTLRTTGVPTTTAVRALRGELSDAERAGIDRQLDRLCGKVSEARRQLEPSGNVERPPAEERMSLAFVAFLMRTRLESYPVGRPAGGRHGLRGLRPGQPARGRGSTHPGRAGAPGRRGSIHPRVAAQCAD